MKTWKSLVLASLFLAGCADVKNDIADSDVTGSGGSSGGSSSGGADSSTGGIIGVGNSSSTGGASTTGGASSGGSSTGGAATGGASTGGASTGGASTGGAATGGAATGGAPPITSGDCAGKPYLADWKVDSSRAMGDQVVIQCDIAQATCSGLPTKVDLLFECISTHVPNCVGQSPSGGTGVWKYVLSCQ